MRVLVTGAAGNLGQETIANLLDAQHQVRAFDLPGKHTERLVQRHGARIDQFWGDLTQRSDVAGAMRGVDVVIHNAALIPPPSEKRPDLSWRVNVEGTQHVIDAALAQPTPPRVMLASSIAVYGPRQDQAPPARVDDPIVATDHYSTHKIECEKRLRESGLTWLVTRIGASPPAKPQGGDPDLLRFMFERDLDSRVEFIHPKDVGMAQARAVDVEEAWNRVLLLGGGPRCHLRNRDLMHRMFERLGIGALPDEAFGGEPLYGDWMDTEESQRLLDYQRHTFDDFLDEVGTQFGLKRLGVKLVAPLVRRVLLRYSEAYKKSRN